MGVAAGPGVPRQGAARATGIPLMRWMTASGWISFRGDEVYFSRIDLRGFLETRGQGMCAAGRSRFPLSLARGVRLTRAEAAGRC